MSRYHTVQGAQPGCSYSNNRSFQSNQEDEIIKSLEAIFSSNSYNCYYKSRVAVAQANAALAQDNQQRQNNADQRNQDLQQIYLRDSPKAKLQLCISFEKYRCLTLKYFKVFAPSRQSVYSYDIFLEINDKDSNLMEQIADLKICLQSLIESQKNCSFMPLRNVYLQVTTVVSPQQNFERMDRNSIAQIVSSYSQTRSELQEQLSSVFQEIAPQNFKQQFCYQLQIDEQQSSEINRSQTPVSKIVDFVQQLEFALSYLFPQDVIAIPPHQFFESAFYERNETLLKESLKSYSNLIVQILSFQKHCGSFQDYCPIRIYFDLFSE